MRAALMVEAKQPFVVEDIAYHAPSKGRVLVRTGASPFCSTDCVNWRGELSKIPPTVLGHASMGYVEEVGEGVDNVKVGDRVIVPGTSECNVCFYCSIGRPDQCSETFDRGGIWPDVADRDNGEPVNAAGNVGGYAEVMNVTANQVWAIESDLPDEVLGCMGCGITTGLGMVFHVAKVQPGQSVAVVGLGHLGQWTVQAAKVAGARTIIAVDPIAYRRELAGTLGATHAVDPSAEDSDRRRPGAHGGPRGRRRARGRDRHARRPRRGAHVAAGRHRRALQRAERRRRRSRCRRSRSRCRAARSSPRRTATCACGPTSRASPA